MKQFIYLDNDIVNSIIAQKDNGLIQDIKLGESDLCPVCSSIYKSEQEIMNDILNFHCHQCDHINKNLSKQCLDIIGGEV